MNIKSTLARLLLFISFISVACASSAHHSFAMFDQSKKVTIAGKVTDVQWTNPHVWIFLDVPDANGEIVQWGVEFTSKVHLTRRGFDPDMVHVGDQVEFTVSPYASGKPGGRFFTVKRANGQYYCDVGAAQRICQENN